VRTELADDPARDTDLRGPVVLFMATAAAVGTAAIYPLQPAIADVAIAQGSSTSVVGMALACGPAGYLVGGSLGTAFGTAAVAWIGWSGTTTVAVAAIALGVAITCARDPR
jgi:hypothetical protein